MAKTVFADTLPYGRIFIGNINSSTVAITVATDSDKEKANYVLVWGRAYSGDATQYGFSAIFIHELTHVWQSQYAGFAMAFMAESVWAQLKNGVKDIFRDGVRKGVENIEEMIKKRDVSQWNQHRSKAYVFGMGDIGKPWAKFNVEQQASIVETWFGNDDLTFIDGTKVTAGRRSPKDPRYPYIEHNIRARSNSAGYTPVQNPQGILGGNCRNSVGSVRPRIFEGPEIRGRVHEKDYERRRARIPEAEQVKRRRRHRGAEQRNPEEVAATG